MDTTGQENLSYIGHSQGTTAFFVMTSELPEYNNKVRLMIAFAPVAYMANVKSWFLRLISSRVDQLEVSIYKIPKLKIIS